MVPLDLTSNADDVASQLAGDVVDEAAERAHRVAAAEGLSLVDRAAPRRTGRMANGLRVDVRTDGWAVVDAVPYAAAVDARTGFATRTILNAEDRLALIYEDELQESFDSI